MSLRYVSIKQIPQNMSEHVLKELLCSVVEHPELHCNLPQLFHSDLVWTCSMCSFGCEHYSSS
jgi:hypothetical protein